MEDYNLNISISKANAIAPSPCCRVRHWLPSRHYTPFHLVVLEVANRVSKDGFGCWLMVLYEEVTLPSWRGRPRLLDVFVWCAWNVPQVLGKIQLYTLLWLRRGRRQVWLIAEGGFEWIEDTFISYKIKLIKIKQRDVLKQLQVYLQSVRVADI